METIYKGTASLGRFKGKLTFYIMSIISVVLFMFAIYYFFINDTNFINTTAIIKKVNCTQFIDNQGTHYDCILEVQYKIEDKEYNANIMTYHERVGYFVGQSIEITYDKTNPTNVTLKKLSNKMISIILFGVGLILVGIGYFTKYMTEHFEIYAAAEGVGTTLGIVSAPFRTQ